MSNYAQIYTKEGEALSDVLRQFQLEELKLLKEISRELQANNIDFYVIGGCSIGALRHKGFIPWDDDVDIAVMRKDFDRTEEVLSKVGGTMLYDPVESHKIPDAPLGHAYMLCDKPLEDSPRIDVFAIDNVPDSKLSRKYQKLCALIYHVCILRRPAENRGKLKKALTYAICNFVPKFMLDWLQRLSYKGLTKWQLSETEYVSNIFGVSGDRETVPKSYFGTPRFVPFEDTLVPIAEKAEEYNTHIYGDFMELPPEEKRVPSHFSNLTNEMEYVK